MKVRHLDAAYLTGILSLVGGVGVKAVSVRVGVGCHEEGCGGDAIGEAARLSDGGLEASSDVAARAGEVIMTCRCRAGATGGAKEESLLAPVEVRLVSASRIARLFGLAPPGEELRLSLVAL